jgi:putative peptidoglycan lipid II flippase
MGIEPIYAMACGVMVGGVLQLGVQIPALHRAGPAAAHWPGAGRIAWPGRPGTRAQHRPLMLPALLGVGVAQMSAMINTQIASHGWPRAASAG